MAKKPVINVELANSFRSMVGFPAWKHLEHVMRMMVEDHTMTEDQTPIDKLTVALVAEARGVRKAIRLIKEEVDQFLV